MGILYDALSRLHFRPHSHQIKVSWQIPQWSIYICFMNRTQKLVLLHFCVRYIKYIHSGNRADIVQYRLPLPYRPLRLRLSPTTANFGTITRYTQVYHWWRSKTWCKWGLIKTGYKHISVYLNYKDMHTQHMGKKKWSNIMLYPIHLANWTIITVG